MMLMMMLVQRTFMIPIVVIVLLTFVFVSDRSFVEGKEEATLAPKVVVVDQDLRIRDNESTATNDVYDVYKEKEFPLLHPTGKHKILFVSHYWTNTDVNQMLDIADELKAREHQHNRNASSDVLVEYDISFIVMEPYVAKVKNRGYPQVIGTPNAFVEEKDDFLIKNIFTFRPHQKSWYSYIHQFIHCNLPIAAKYYESSLIVTKQYLLEHGKPDLIFISKATESVIDLSYALRIPTMILFSGPLGSMGHYYEDAIGAPDSNFWSPLSKQTSLLPRLYKPLGKLLIFLHPQSALSLLYIAKVRFENNLDIFALPGTNNWKVSPIISTWSLGLDISRKLRPLTFMVGFLTQNPYLEYKDHHEKEEDTTTVTTTNDEDDDDALSNQTKEEEEPTKTTNEPMSCSSVPSIASSSSSVLSTSSGVINPYSLLSKIDQDYFHYLNYKSDGVIFGAFGTLAVIHEEWFEAIVNGMDLWVQEQNNNNNNNSNKAGAILAISIETTNKHLKEKIHQMQNERQQQQLKNNTTTATATTALEQNPHTIQIGNVIITNWVNQKLILSNRHTKVFITHGGLGSISESIHALVPMLVFPIFFDQPNNSYRIEEANIGVAVHYRDIKGPITKELIYSKLKLLTSQEDVYRTNLQKQYIISKHHGGVQRVGAIVEEYLLLNGDFRHLIPIEERMPFPANCNLDLYVVVLGMAVCAAYVAYTMASWYLFPVLEPYFTTYLWVPYLEPYLQRHYGSSSWSSSNSMVVSVLSYWFPLYMESLGSNSDTNNNNTNEHNNH